GRGMTHGEDVVGAIGEQDFRNRGRRQQREQDLHDFLFAVDAVEVAEPGVAGAQLRARLFQNEAALWSLDPQDGVGYAPAQGFNAGRAGTYPSALAQVIKGIGGGQLEHGPIPSGSSPWPILVSLGMAAVPAPGGFENGT